MEAGPGQGWAGREPNWRPRRARPQEKMVASAQAQGGGGARTGGAEEEGWGVGGAKGHKEEGSETRGGV